MKRHAFWAFLAAIAVWQIEMAVQAGIAASRRTAPNASAAAKNKASQPVCTGPSCPTPQQPHYAPQRVIIRSQ